jgi:hypothetical protein
MLFSDFLPSVTCPDTSRLALLNAILFDVQTAFPDLCFELRLDRRVINAQAILLDEKRCVLIYGGLALHPSLAEASLTFVFLHEAGHHMGMGPRLPFNLSLACDCVADHWAAGEGAEILYRNSGRQLEIGEALNELESLMSDRRESGLHHSEKISNCWNRSWSQRKGALRALLLPNDSCELMLDVVHC